MKSKIIILLFIFISIIYANDFNEYLEGLNLYPSEIDTLLVKQYPDSTMETMLDYLKTNDYGKQYIAMRILKIFNNNKLIIESMKSNNIEIKHVFKVADSLFEDSEMEELAINGNSKTIISYISFLKNRFNKNDFGKLLIFAANENKSVKVSAINAVIYFIEKNHSFIEELPFDTVISLYERSGIYGKEQSLKLMKYYPIRAMEYADELIMDDHYSILQGIRIIALFEKYDNEIVDNRGQLKENVNILQNYLKRNKNGK